MQLLINEHKKNQTKTSILKQMQLIHHLQSEAFWRIHTFTCFLSAWNQEFLT